IFQRRHDRALFIGQCRAVRRLNDRGAIIRQIDGQMTTSVCEINFHCERKRIRNGWCGKAFVFRGESSLTLRHVPLKYPLVFNWNSMSEDKSVVKAVVAPPLAPLNIKSKLAPTPASAPKYFV